MAPRYYPPARPSKPHDERCDFALNLYFDVLLGLIINKRYICVEITIMNCPIVNFVEVFTTAHGAVYQCNNRNCYWLEFAGGRTPLRVSDFLKFKKQIDQIDVSKLLGDCSRSADFTIVMPQYTERCFVLCVQDILRLRELLDGAKFMIELNSLVRECLRSTPARVLG